MLASRFANPAAVAASSHPRNESNSANELKSAEELQPPAAAATADSNAPATKSTPSTNSVDRASTSSQGQDAADSAPASKNASISQELATEHTRLGSPDDAKPLPPLPHVAELLKQQNLPEPPIILASSPGVTTPEISTVSPEPTLTAISTPIPTVDSANNQAASRRKPSVTEPGSRRALSYALPAPTAPATPATPTTPTVPAAKARRSKAGKPCAIKLPTDRAKTYFGYPVPLSLDDFRARIENFEKAGYDTRGFGYWKDEEGITTDTGPAQARDEFPDPVDQKNEQKQRNFGVSIPNKKKWDDYVNDLMEEKLRALGVTSGDDEPAPTLSRQVSSHVSSPYPSLPLSPPVPSSSSASQHMWQNTMPFSAPFSPAASTNNTSIGAVASPVSSIGQQAYPGHMSRQSTMGFPFPSGQAPFTFQQPWSPQQLASMQGPPQIASPSVSGGSKRATSGLSIESPDLLSERQPTPRGQPSSAQGGSRAEQALSWRSNFQPEQAQGKENGSSDAAKDEATHNAFADLASPKPQGHRHNISANLEREAAQYYPGEYVNESREASPVREASADLNDSNINDSSDRVATHKPKSSHASNASVSSRLNIAAKEFKYDPGSSHSRNFSMSNDVFLPGAPKAAKAADATSSVQLTTAHSHQGSVSTSNLNVAAPEFKPPAQKNFAFSSSWFNFSAKKPTEAAKPETQKTVTSEDKVPTIGSKIFGNIAEIVKPSKKSKAIPIVHPDEVKGDESEAEDEDGRIVQSDTRRKKGRFADDDGDEVPRFAEPTPEPEPAAQPMIRPPINTDLRASPAAPSSRGSEQDTLRPKPPQPTLDYDLETGDNLSDGSNVPWHGIESDDRLEEHEETSDIREPDLLTSPTGESGMDELAGKRDSRGLSPETPASHGGRQASMNLGDEDSLLYPSFQELDAVMDYINKDNSDFGMEEDKQVGQDDDLFLRTAQTHISGEGLQDDEIERDYPAHQAELSQQKSVANNDTAVANSNEPNWDHELPVLEKISSTRKGASPVRKLNKMAEAPVSDWDDMLSSGAELNIPPQNHLNDAHVATLVEGLLRRHLAPFERQLKDLTASIKRPPVSEFSKQRPISAYEKSESDADDEEDSDRGSRLRSRGARSDRRMDQIRSAVIDAMATSQSGGFTQIEQEVKFRKAAENRADDLQRLLTLSEREIALFKESTAASDEKIRGLEQEQADLRHRHRGVEEELRTKTLDFTAEVAALENTLDEYRTSSTKWREEIDSVKGSRERLETTIQKLKTEADDHQRQREELHAKIAKAEEELSLSNTKLKTERSMWDRRSEKETAELENLQGKLSEAMQSKDRLGQEIARLSDREKEAIRSAVLLEETQNAKSKLEQTVNKLNEKTIEHQTIVARYEREASDAHENTTVQVERTKSLMQTDVDIANKKVENIRADLETRLEMAKSELDNVRKDNEAVRSRYERSLNEANAARKEALQDAADAANTRLQEERKRFEHSLNELSSQHDRTMRNSIEDKQRSETHLNSSLKLAESKVTHMEDQIHHLEERLSVAQSAAQAAAVAAQAAKSQQQVSAPASTSRSAPTTSISTPSHLEKISPQALRESIVVLQEQLQEREARIDSLESEISSIGRDAPTKLRERETEIGWLRELLGVRIDDLSDLVNNLQMEKFDRGAARNAAIRIKASLEMEQQEKDRVLHGVKPAGPASALPSLTDIQNFASPKAAQLTSAFNNWRKSGSPSLAGMREAVNSSTPSKPAVNPARREMPTRGSSSAGRKAQDQASNPTGLRNPIAASAAANAGKQTDAQAFLSGLMTPPASNLRRTPSTGAASVETARPQTPVRPGSSSKADLTGSPGAHMDPTTPPLLRKGDYDLDAELGPDRMAFEGSGDEDETEGDATEEAVEGTNLEPLGEVVAAPTAD